MKTRYLLSKESGWNRACEVCGEHFYPSLYSETQIVTCVRVQ